MRLFFRFFAIFLFSLLSTGAFSQTSLAVSFRNGFIGTRGNNNGEAESIRIYSTLGISRSYFIQTSATGSFITNTQGNDIPGTVRLVFTDGTSRDIAGGISWRENVSGGGNSLLYFGFIPAAGTVSFTITQPGGGGL
jgi:hypothetical protein